MTFLTISDTRFAASVAASRVSAMFLNFMTSIAFSSFLKLYQLQRVLIFYRF